MEQAALYTRMMKTEKRRVKPLAKVGTLTALARLTEQAAMYTRMMKTGIRRVMPLAQVGTVTALARLTEQALYTRMMKTEI